jgi:FkbM family methyltransferase
VWCFIVTNKLLKTPHGEFCVDARDRFLGDNLSLAEIDLARSLLSNPQSTILVVGAHVGTVAIPLSRACRELVAIEANPETFVLLERNIAHNGCDNIRAFNVAANDESRAIEFLANTENSGGSKRMPKFQDAGYFSDDPAIVTVPGVRLDDYLADFPAFDMVFMDCEGSEYFAFLGMPKILRQARTLMVEFLPHHLSRVAGITVEQFIEPLSGFDHLCIPSKNGGCTKADFLSVLQNMFDNCEVDSAIVFARCNAQIDTEPTGARLVSEDREVIAR